MTGTMTPCNEVLASAFRGRFAPVWIRRMIAARPAGREPRDHDEGGVADHVTRNCGMGGAGAQQDSGAAVGVELASDSVNLALHWNSMCGTRGEAEDGEDKRKAGGDSLQFETGIRKAERGTAIAGREEHQGILRRFARPQN